MPARDRLRKALAEIELREPGVPVVANVDALPHTDPDDWRSLLGSQLCSPVRWRQTLHHMEEAGVSTLVELGPGNLLSGMAKRTVKKIDNIAVGTPEDVDTLLATVVEGGRQGPATSHGEHLYTSERLVVAPGAGVFSPAVDLVAGTHVAVGALLGTISGSGDVHSPFAGILKGMLAVDGERVQARQPVAWLGSESAPGGF